MSHAYIDVDTHETAIGETDVGVACVLATCTHTTMRYEYE